MGQERIKRGERIGCKTKGALAEMRGLRGNETQEGNVEDPADGGGRLFAGRDRQEKRPGGVFVPRGGVLPKGGKGQGAGTLVQAGDSNGSV